jgi:sugar phosphate isomerase/epimerase
MRSISLAHLTVLDADPLTLIDAGASGGFDAIGLRIVPPLPGDAIVPVVGDIPLQRRIKERLAATGLRILDIEAIWLSPQTQVDALQPALDVGAELGARYVLTVGFDAEPGRLLDHFGRLCRLANARGLRPMLEFIPYATVADLDSAHHLLRQAAPTDAGLLVDALHLSRSGGSPVDIARYDPGLFSYVHLCDASAAPPPAAGLRAEARGERLYPGLGELWLDAFLDAFAPDTPVGVEAPSAAFAALPPAERARHAGEATRRLLARSAAGRR